MDYTNELYEIIVNQQQIIELLQQTKQATFELNGYAYILIFLLAGVGLIYMMYKFLKIFI